MTDADQCRADWLRDNLVIGSGAFDPADLRRVSMTRVLAEATQDVLEKVDAGPKAVAKALARIDPELRGLLALNALLQGWYHYYPPDKLFRHVFCGGWGNLAPEIVEALAAAGATQQEEVLRKALGQFDERIWRNAFKRSEKFGGYWDPPNALASTMVELGEAFGTRKELVRIAADYTAASPALVAFCEAERAKLDEDERLGWLIETLIRRSDFRGDDAPARLAAIPDPYRALYLTAYAEFEIYNGGISQYFTNSSGQLAPMAVEAFETIGLPKQASVIAKGVAMFPEPFPNDPGAYTSHVPETGKPADREPDEDDRLWSKEWDRKLSRLTKSFGKWEPVREAIAAYARREGAVPD